MITKICLTSFFYFSIAIAGFLCGYYIYLIRRYQKNWRALPSWKLPPDFIPSTKLTILIPARNEAENIHDCLKAVLQQNYPSDLFEVIVIDDHSTDSTVAIVENLQKKHPGLKILRLEDFSRTEDQTSFKKWAIELGISQASGDLIVGTDADCLVPKDWLPLLVSFYESKNDVFIAAPVNFHKEQNTLGYFQSLDFVGMMGITGAGIHGQFQHICNGANLAYEKTAFQAVGGFAGIDGKASGDDMLLLQKMIGKFPNRIGFLKNPEATVLTTAMPDWKSFISQRLRWASKSYDYPEWRVTLRLALVFAFCWGIILSFLMIPIMGWGAGYIFLAMLSVKGLMDYIFLGEMSRYFGRKYLMKKYLRSIPLHIIYIAWVGLLANITQTYEWKGRRLK